MSPSGIVLVSMHRYRILALFTFPNPEGLGMRFKIKDANTTLIKDYFLQILALTLNCEGNFCDLAICARLDIR